MGETKGRPREFAPETFACCSCGKRYIADEHDRKWLNKNPGQQPLWPCCAIGGYFGGA